MKEWIKMNFRLEDLLKIIKGDFVCVLDNSPINHERIGEYKNHAVKSVRAQEGFIVVELQPWNLPMTYDCSGEEWYKEYIKQFGTEPSFS